MSVKRKVTVPEGKLANEGAAFVLNRATFGTTFDVGFVDLLRLFSDRNGGAGRGISYLPHWPIATWVA